MRWIPFVAQCIAIATFIQSLVTLLAGSTGTNFENAAILTFNMSSLGMNEYHNPNASTTALNSNINSLLPAGVTNPPSLTHYLGVKDWYSMHYLRTCSGFYAPSTSNPTLLTSTKINITCTKQHLGYSLSVYASLQEDLKPSVQGLLQDIPAKSYNTAPWAALWIIGIMATIVLILLLPWTFEGVRRINGYCVLCAFLSYIPFNIVSGISTGTILAARSLWGQTAIPSSGGYLSLTWSATALAIICFILTQMEWRFELWTFKGDRITLYRKPQCKSWFLMEALMKPEQIHGERVGEDGIEMG